MRRILKTVLRIEQHFRPSELEPIVDLLEAGSDEVDICATVTQSVMVLLPERSKTVCVSLSWGGGVPATDAIWDRDLNESLRSRRCLVPFSRMWDGFSSEAAWHGGVYLAAGLLCWSADPAMEACIVLGGRSHDAGFTTLSPLAVAPTFAHMWTHGTACDDLIRLLQGPPWSEPIGNGQRSQPTTKWDHVRLAPYRTALS